MAKLPNTAVFARITPADKMNIIQGYGSLGLTVAMTGDGVNDAPALVAADLGLAMGKTGTEVAKEAADIVLLDDNFTTINAAVEEGRSIYKTIRKVLLYLFSTSLGELLTVSIAILAGLPAPLLAVQILWLNFVTDGFLTVALGMEPKEHGLLKEPFAKPSRFLLTGSDLNRMLVMGGVMTLTALWLYTRDGYSLVYRQTLVLTLLAVLQWFNAWNCRSERSIFSSRPFKNKWLWLAMVCVIGLQILAVYWPPLQSILKTEPLLLPDWIIITLLSLVIIIMDEAWKALSRKV
jgi:Ca2+-transporting ATPase